MHSNKNSTATITLSHKTLTQGRPVTLSGNIRDLEQMVDTFFGCLLAFWCDFDEVGDEVGKGCDRSPRGYLLRVTLDAYEVGE